MEQIHFKCEVVTPMFLAGADGKTAEFRAPSLKGVLRFWWRGINPNRLQDEGSIWGTESGGGNASKVYVRTHFKDFTPSKNPFPKHHIQVQSKGKSFPINILDYLAYGTSQGNVLVRDYIPPKTDFEITLGFRDQYCKEEVLKVFSLLWQFGGMGARSRNGFGSFNVSGLTRTDLINLYDVLPSFTAFSKQSKLFQCKEISNTWDKAMADLGTTYRDCRGKLEPRHTCEKRQYIGSPISIDRGLKKSFLDRRAKAYFMKIRKEGERYRGYILFLPSEYCNGLEQDHNGRKIDHKRANYEFNKTTDEFNNLLLKTNKFQEVPSTVLQLAGGERKHAY